MVMKKNEFYSVVLRKRIMIPENKIKNVVKKGRRFAVGLYTAKTKEGKMKEYQAWKILGMATPTKKKKK